MRWRLQYSRSMTADVFSKDDIAKIVPIKRAGTATEVADWIGFWHQAICLHHWPNHLHQWRHGINIGQIDL